jgi:hypothetical protein
LYYSFQAELSRHSENSSWYHLNIN